MPDQLIIQCSESFTRWSSGANEREGTRGCKSGVLVSDYM